MYLKGQAWGYDASKHVTNLPIAIVILPPEAITVTDSHELVEQHLCEQISRSTHGLKFFILGIGGDGLSQTTGPYVATIDVIVVNISQIFNVPGNDLIHTIKRVELFKAVEPWQAIGKTGSVEVWKAVIPSPLHVNSHEVTSGEVQWSKHFSSQIRSDDGILTLSCLGRHSEIQGIHVGLGYWDLRIPEGVASTNGKVSCISRSIIVVWSSHFVSWISTSIVKCVLKQLLNSLGSGVIISWLPRAKTLNNILPATVCLISDPPQERVCEISSMVLWVKGQSRSKQAVTLPTITPIEIRTTI